jgi:single-strand DNA-binding protein
MLNSVSLVGRLVKDPETTNSQNNMTICKFTLAVDRKFKKEGQPTADFPRIVCFGKTAENVGKYMSKGRLVGVTGRLQTGSYKDKDDRMVYTTDVIADSVEFLDKAKEGQGSQENEDFRTVEMSEDDLPF